MADFHDLQGKLEPLISTKGFYDMKKLHLTFICIMLFYSSKSVKLEALHGKTVPSLDLRVGPSVSIQTDKRVYAITAKSLLQCITFIPYFWNVIQAKLFVK